MAKNGAGDPPGAAKHTGAAKHPVAKIEGPQPGRDNKGRFAPGAPPGPGRPPGVVNTITKSLREQVLAGFDKRGISGFVEDLLDTSPPSAAALLTRLLPPEPVEDTGAAVIESVEIMTIPRGHYVLPEDLGASSFLYNQDEVDAIQAIQAQARQRADALRHTLLDSMSGDDRPDNGSESP